MRRPAHQLFDLPTVLEDPVAVPIIGSAACAQLKTTAGDDRFGSLIDLSGADINARYFSGRSDGLRVGESGLTHLMGAERH